MSLRSEWRKELLAAAEEEGLKKWPRLAGLLESLLVEDRRIWSHRSGGWTQG